MDVFYQGEEVSIKFLSQVIENFYDECFEFCQMLLHLFMTI